MVNFANISLSVFLLGVVLSAVMVYYLIDYKNKSLACSEDLCRKKNTVFIETCNGTNRTTTYANNYLPVLVNKTP